MLWHIPPPSPPPQSSLLELGRAETSGRHSVHTRGSSPPRNWSSGTAGSYFAYPLTCPLKRCPLLERVGGMETNKTLQYKLLGLLCKTKCGDSEAPLCSHEASLLKKTVEPAKCCGTHRQHCPSRGSAEIWGHCCIPVGCSSAQRKCGASRAGMQTPRNRDQRDGYQKGVGQKMDKKCEGEYSP